MSDATDSTTVDKPQEGVEPFRQSPSETPVSAEVFERLPGGGVLTEVSGPECVSLAAHPNPEGISATDTTAHVRLSEGANGELVGRSSRSEAPAAGAHETELVRRAEQIAVARGQDRLAFETPALGEKELRVAEWQARGYCVTLDGTVLRASKEDLGENPVSRAEGGVEGESAALDSSVTRAQEEIRSAPTEVLYAFGPNGETLVRQEGTVNEVDVTPEQAEAMRDCAVLLHNHPSGASFSGCDIATAIESDAGELRAVAPNGSAYVLRPPEGRTFRDTVEQNPGLGGEVRSARLSGDFGWARSAIETTWENQCAEVQQSVSQRVLDHLVPPEQAQMRMYDEAASRLADRWGLQYERQEGS